MNTRASHLTGELRNMREAVDTLSSGSDSGPTLAQICDREHTTLLHTVLVADDIDMLLFDHEEQERLLHLVDLTFTLRNHFATAGVYPRDLFDLDGTDRSNSVEYERLSDTLVRLRVKVDGSTFTSVLPPAKWNVGKAAKESGVVE